jgi:2-(1,2-epoxy-1,2-dihydrophenyl)acetyl-CoA isomerase
MRDGHRPPVDPEMPSIETADRAAIEELLDVYGHIMDDADWAALDRVFTDDAVCDWTGFGLRVTTSLKDLRSYFRADVRHPNAHHVTNVVVDLSGDDAIVRSKLLAVLDDGSVVTGEYRDRLRRTADGWRIHERTAIPRPRTGKAHREEVPPSPEREDDAIRPTDKRLVESGFETIRLEEEGEVLWLVLDRPETLNALSGQMQTELIDAIGSIAGIGAKAVILTGEGRSFCSGADLRRLPEDVDLSDIGAMREFMRGWADVILGIRQLPVPTVAAVAGHAYGGGLNLALACDIVIVTPDSRLCQSYVDRGVPTDLAGSFILPRLVGWGRARRMLLSGEVIDGEEAVHIGLASVVAGEASLHDEARRWATRLAAKDPQAVAGMRTLIDSGTDGSLEEALEREGEAVAAVLATPGIREKLLSYRKS